MQETVWQIQSGIPVVFQALEVDLPRAAPIPSAWHRYQPVKPVEVAPNHWRWEIKDMQALDLRDVKIQPGLGGAGGAHVRSMGRCGRRGQGQSVAGIGLW